MLDRRSSKIRIFQCTASLIQKTASPLAWLRTISHYLSGGEEPRVAAYPSGAPPCVSCAISRNLEVGHARDAAVAVLRGRVRSAPQRIHLTSMAIMRPREVVYDQLLMLQTEASFEDEVSFI